jgi:mannose-6-phosphate isomerase-like protein (cupin superfamily)
MKKKITKRPWGEFETFCKNSSCTVKILSIKPNQMLSLQSHKKRDELWTVLDGKGTAQVGPKRLSAKKGSEFFIKRGRAHRLIAKGTGIRVLEVSFGKFDERDEKRIDDKYGRLSPQNKKR